MAAAGNESRSLRTVKAIGTRLVYPLTVNKAIWIDWFVLHLSGLRRHDSRASLSDLAHEVYPHLGHLDPIEAAQAEFDAPPPQRIGGTRWPGSFSDTTAPQALGGSLHDTAAARVPAAKVTPSAAAVAGA